MINNTIGYMICETAATSEPKSTIVADNGRRVVAEVLLQDMNVKNRNGRFYSDKWMIPQLTSQRTTELLRSGNLKGENGHPMEKDISRQQTIDPKCVCHKIIKLWHEGNDILAHVVGANTQWGEYFDQDLRDGEKPSFSLRALGTVKNTSRGAEVENITVITWDRVYFPSHKRAYTKGLVTESAAIAEAQNDSRLKTAGNNKLVLESSDSGLLVPINNEKIRSYIMSESKNIYTMKESFDMLYESIDIINNGTKVQMTDKSGNTFIINLESHIQNDIMNYCSKNIIL